MDENMNMNNAPENNDNTNTVNNAAANNTSDNNQPQNTASGVSIASLCCGIAGFCINPFYLVNLAAIVTGIIGIAQAGNKPKGMAIAGLALGVVGAMCQFVVDLLFGFTTCCI